jgi:hypothetical protein
MGNQPIGDWNKTKAFLDNLVPQAKKAYKTGLNKVGQAATRELKKGMTSGSPGGKTYAPNHPFTIARKGSSKPLIQDGDLRNNINYKPYDGGVFVGVLRQASAKTKDGKSYLADIAAIHELGNGAGGDLLIEITPKSRAWMHANGFHVKNGTKYIRIPRRETFGPVFEKNAQAWQDLFFATVMEGTGFKK